MVIFVRPMTKISSILPLPIDEIANPLSAASSQDDEEVLSPEEKIIQLNLEKKK